MIRFDHTALYHVSEQADIELFRPRPTKQHEAKVWAVRGSHIQNYLFPRDCPRICIWANKATNAQDKTLLGGAKTHIFIEQNWLTRCATAELYIYQFEEGRFVLEDKNAGYMTSTQAQAPIKKQMLAWRSVDFAALATKLDAVPNLMPYRDKILASGLAYSMIRLRNAQPIQSMPI